jgi:serine protease Do
MEPSSKPTVVTQPSTTKEETTDQSVLLYSQITPNQAAPKFGLPHRLTWLLLGFLLAVGLLARQNAPTRVYQYTQFALPTVEAPTGQLAKVYDVARPASVQIEARSSDSSYLGAPIGIGTGFFITSDGYLLTAYHVVDTSDLGLNNDFRRSIKYVAISPDETEYDLELVGFDAYFDLAVLKAEVHSTVPFLPLATGRSEVGEKIVAIGNSRGDFLQGRAGLVSRIGVDRPRARFADDTIELSAALAPGDSGGPVLNEKGEAIGVVSFISFVPDRLNSDTNRFTAPFLRGFVDERDFAAYAVPIFSDSDMVAGLRMGQRHDIPVIGFSGPPTQTGLPDSYDPQRFAGINLGELPGPIVWEVRPDGPADRAGLQDIVVDSEGITSADVIVAIDNEPTPTFNDLIEKLYLKGVGETVTVTVQRGNETFTLRLELAAKSEVFN